MAVDLGPVLELEYRQTAKAGVRGCAVGRDVERHLHSCNSEVLAEAPVLVWMCPAGEADLMRFALAAKDSG